MPMMEDVQVSPQEIPALMRAARCSLPLIFTTIDHPEYPGMRGTCTALSAYGKVIFVTAAHVVKGTTDRTKVEVALGFRGEPLRSHVRSVLIPRPSATQYEGACDFAVMIPDRPPAFVAGESAPYSLARVARMESVLHGNVFAVCGHPTGLPGRNTVDYDAGKITFGLHIAVGTYDAPSPIQGLHALNLSTTKAGGPNGFSGGPVFRLVRDNTSMEWTPIFAGIVTLGGPNRIQFIDTAYLNTFLIREGVFAPR